MKLRMLCIIGAAATVASAQRFDLFVYENDDNADMSGMEIYFEIFDVGGAIDFEFHNDSTGPMFVSAVYFEDSFAGLVNGLIQNESAGVDFELGASPAMPAPPGAGFGGDWLGNLFDADAESPSEEFSINAGVGETLTIRFDLDGIGFGDVVDALGSDPRGLRIATHIQGIGGNDGDSAWGINVPAPATLVAFGGLVALASRRRR